MKGRKRQRFLQDKALLWGMVQLSWILLWPVTSLAQSAWQFNTQNALGGDIAVTNLGDFNPGVQGESSRQHLLLSNSEFLYSAQEIERDFFDGDFILHRYDGENRTEVARLPIKYDFEVGLNYMVQNNKVIFERAGEGGEFLIFDGASEELTLHSVDSDTNKEYLTVVGASAGYGFVVSTYYWGENDGNNIKTVFRLSQEGNVAIELPVDLQAPLEQQVSIFSDGVYIKADKGYVLLDDSDNPAELASTEAGDYLFDWNSKLVLLEKNTETVVWLDKQSLQQERFPGDVLGYVEFGEDMKALVKVGEQLQLWTFASDGSWSAQNLSLPAELSPTGIRLNGATEDSIYFISASNSQAGNTSSWWRLHLETFEFTYLAALSSSYGVAFQSIGNTAFLGADSDLWRSTGEAESTEQVVLPDDMTLVGLNSYVFDNKLLMVSDSAQYGREWLAIDTQGVHEVLDLVSGADGSGLTNRVNRNMLFNGSFYSLQSTPATGNELFVYSDLESLPEMVDDLAPKSIGFFSFPSIVSVDMLPNQDLAFVDFLNTNAGRQILVTDGTPQNSFSVPDDQNASHRVFGNRYYRKGAESVSKFNPETREFENFVSLPEDMLWYELIGEQNGWLVYKVGKSDAQTNELLITDGETVLNAYTGNSAYISFTNGNLYFYHLFNEDDSRWHLYRYNIATNELKQLMELGSPSHVGELFRVFDGYELLLVNDQNGYLQEIKKLNADDELESVYVVPQNKLYSMENILFDGKFLLKERDTDLQPFMSPAAFFLDIATGQLQPLAINSLLETLDYAVNYRFYDKLLAASLFNINRGENQCFLINQEGFVRETSICNKSVFSVGDDNLIISALSDGQGNYNNLVQVVDKDLNEVFDYETQSTGYHQTQYHIEETGIFYHLGNGNREELWWKGTTNPAPVKVLDDLNEFVEQSGLNSLRSVSWRGINGRLLMRGEEDSIGAEPFVLNLFCNPEIELVSASDVDENGAFIMDVTPGTTEIVEFTVKSMLPMPPETIQFSTVPNIAMQITKEAGLFTLTMDVASEFTGDDGSFTLSASGECGESTATINLQPLVTTPPEVPPSETPVEGETPVGENTSGGGSSGYWVLSLLALSWLRRIKSIRLV